MHLKDTTFKDVNFVRAGWSFDVSQIGTSTTKILNISSDICFILLNVTFSQFIAFFRHPDINTSSIIYGMQRFETADVNRALPSLVPRRSLLAHSIWREIA